MRDVKVDAVYTRNVYDIIDLGDLTISKGSAYTAGDYLHTDVLTVSNAFLDRCDSFLEVVGIIVRETLTSGTLQSPSLKAIFFDTCDMSITANSAFDFSDGSSTTADNVKGIGAVTSYDTIGSDTSISTTMFSNPVVIGTGTTNRYFKMILVTTGTPTFDSTANINVSVIVKGH